LHLGYPGMPPSRHLGFSGCAPVMALALHTACTVYCI